MKTIVPLVVAFMVLVFAFARSSADSQGSTGGGQGQIDPSVVAQVGAALAGHRVAQPPMATRGGRLTELYWANVQNAPVVVVDGGTGSGTVIIVNPNRRGYVLTNNHVASHAFKPKGQTPGVFLLFYDSVLKNELFNSQRFADCFGSSSHSQTDWCRGVRSSSRWAVLVATDPTRDLALLSVDNVPSNATGILPENIQALQPGDEVAIIGSPELLLWSLTTGIISAVRTNFGLGTGSGTMIQTQAPLNPGNSGGPMIAPDGKLAGVVFAGSVGQTFLIGGQQVQVPAEGLNYAIGIDQVLAFTRSNLR